MNVTDNSSNPLKVYFMGTGDIANDVLKSLYEDSRVELVGVCTQPDQVKGRKKVPTPSPLGAAAEVICPEISVDKPKTVNTPEFLEYIMSLQPDFLVVIAFGQILRQPLLDAPKFECINIHASILPKYRGASPINAAILSGDADTGVSIMKMEAGLDSGPVNRIIKVAIDQDDTYATLQDKLSKLGADNIVDALVDIAGGEGFVEQDEALVSHVGKISKNDGLADWSLSAEYLERVSRAYNPWPNLFFRLKAGKRERKISVIKATVVENPTNVPAGEFIQADKEAWIVACGEKALRLDLIIPDGSKAMSGPDFLRGVQNITMV